MTVQHSPIHIQTPRSPCVRISIANATRNGSAPIYHLFTAGSRGAFFPGFRYQAQGTATAGVVRIYVQRGGVGNIELKKEVMVSSATPSTTIEAASEEWYPASGIRLGPEDKVFVTTNGTTTFSCWLEGGGDF